MTEYLVFTLSATLGAMGDLAGHERRGSLGWPGRSAVLGLCAAALGIRREDTAGLAALDPLRMAVAIFDEGTPLRDYHTVQTVPTAAAKRPDSRPAALREAGRRVNTTITLRDYRQGPLFGVALWGAELEPLCAALKRPVFTLYLGRKSCPLSAPLVPGLVEAEGPEAALSRVTLPPWRAGAVARLIASDADAGLAGREEWRQDQPIDRAAWHFAPRRVVLAQADIAPGEGP
ncbi:type I-E CRISPR-associated protein Cas5/CasD [Boseongicola sp. H5]|uniref:type I-E CRISPR-associated protein Cas5/CasD n=1 Tax=Boseongicola sp. H5 TaxID=2763261 RepID=UPI001D0B9D86|nr:type I-E CRISPR-associated protein Cas5/CasD [Boseongicola sp. H5]